MAIHCFTISTKVELALLRRACAGAPPKFSRICGSTRTWSFPPTRQCVRPLSCVLLALLKLASTYEARRPQSPESSWWWWWCLRLSSRGDLTNFFGFKMMCQLLFLAWFLIVALGFNGSEASSPKEIHLAGMFPINGNEGWQGGQVSLEIQLFFLSVDFDL